LSAQEINLKARAVTNHKLYNKGLNVSVTEDRASNPFKDNTHHWHFIAKPPGQPNRTLYEQYNKITNYSQ